MWTNKWGYMIEIDSDGRTRMVSDMVWESVYGPIPEGYEIHHRDGNRLNNSIENLVMLARDTHRKYHHGYKYIDGKWYKRCRMCGRILPIDDFYSYKSKSRIRYTGWCKECHRTYYRYKEKIKDKTMAQDALNRKGLLKIKETREDGEK